MGSRLYNGADVETILAANNGIIPLSDLGQTTHTYRIEAGSITGCDDDQDLSEVSWGCNGTHFDQASPEDTDTAEVLLTPALPGSASAFQSATSEDGGRLTVTLKLENIGGALQNRRPPMPYQPMVISRMIQQTQLC